MKKMGRIDRKEKVRNDYIEEKSKDFFDTI